MAWHESHGSGWRVRYYHHGELQTENGFSSKTEAQKRASDVEYEMRNKTFVARSKGAVTFEEWARTWEDAHDVSKGTWLKYRSHLNNHLIAKFGDTPLDEISHIKIKGWAKNLRRNLADATVRDIITLLSMILGDAVEEDLITKNPCRRLKLTLESSPPKETVTARSLLRIVERIPEHRALVLTAAFTGMRWGEIVGLTWRNVNLDEGTITIDHKVGALHENGGKLELGPPKTPCSARAIHLPPFLVELLREHRSHQLHDHVFTGVRGGLLRRANFRSRFWRPAVAGHKQRGWAALQPNLTFHGLRHTHKTWLNEDHVDKALQFERLGHHLPGVEGIYSHCSQPMVDHMLTKLEHRWKQAQSGINGESGHYN